ncbi:MAG TPA: N-acetyltransferase [Ferrovibrio sp.]|uniref:GNAT family N-acetyltransferase n=1 Tax=Ferrovibrio sp. TaxID=1917215 RepID=UPI002ED43FA3
MLIRKARLTDLDALVALENRSFRYNRMSRRSYAAALRNPRALILLARGGRKEPLAGAVVVFFRADSPAARLYSIAVSPQMRGHGLGRKLLRAAESAARAQGASAMRLEVKVRNGAALALYRKSGYGLIGRIAHYYEDGSDAWRLEKPLIRNRTRAS